MKKASARLVVSLVLPLVAIAALGCQPSGRSASSADKAATPVPPAKPEPAAENDAAPAELSALGYVGRPASNAPAGVAPARARAAAMPVSLDVAALDAEREGRKVVRNAHLQLVARDTARAVQELTSLLPAVHGYVAGLTTTRDGELFSYALTIKVPATSFERALEEVKSVAMRVEGEAITTEDVTDRYVDLDARFRALRGTEKELLSLLAESRSRGSKVGDIMEVFGELTSIRTQIEQLQGQMRHIEQITLYSTLDVVLRPDVLARPVVTASWRPSETLHRDLSMLASIGRGLVDLGIGFVVLGLPTMLSVLLICWMCYRLFRFLARSTPAGT